MMTTKRSRLFRGTDGRNEKQIRRVAHTRDTRVRDSEMKRRRRRRRLLTKKAGATMIRRRRRTDGDYTAARLFPRTASSTAAAATATSSSCAAAATGIIIYLLLRHAPRHRRPLYEHKTKQEKKNTKTDGSVVDSFTPF